MTGSTRLLSAEGFADALVGRLEVIELWPFSQGELLGARDGFVSSVFDPGQRTHADSPMTRIDYVRLMLRGGFPEAVARQPGRRAAWYSGYVTTLTEKVIRELSAIERLADIPRVIRLCAARSGEELNVTRFAEELGIPARTLDGYLALLANAFVIQLVPGWSTNVSKKVVRRPKVTFVDSGLAAYLIGTTVERAADPAARIGPLVESFVVMEIRKQLSWDVTGVTCWHFRDRDGAEVDIVLEHPDGRVVGLEVKAASTVSPRDTKGLRFLADRLGSRFHRGYVLSTMPEHIPLGPKMVAAPIDSLWASA